MSADWGWNVVIVLTGTLENLREQTGKRLFGDVNHDGNIKWKKLEHPNRESPVGERAADCKLGPTSRMCHLIVSLKNKQRLEQLILWLNGNAASRAQMRILIIDDEADQGGIDTTPADTLLRSAINQQIIDLTEVAAASVNYVAYTATPYANFLNEAYPESLYPKDFIVALPQSDEHFGPEQIFGVEGTESEGGLGIVNTVPHTDVTLVKALQTDPSSALPSSLQDSLAWFLCATAAVRAYGDIVKPVTMLVHTSTGQAAHKHVAEAIDGYLKGPLDEIIARCRTVWEAQTQLTLGTFKSRMGGTERPYGRLDVVRDYPQFAGILSHITTLLKEVTHIPILDTHQPRYHSGVHLCIDNCANNGVNDEAEYVRLRYPEKDALQALGFAPAFIVVGGSTLSRGLTLENLISTYFLRAGAQMDTLMQMGRWFGYRPGYELLPRIWMPEDTRNKFVFMAGVEEELREDLRRFEDAGADPREYGPRVRIHPKASWLRPTAKNRSKAMTGSEYDFSGVNRQTTIFHSGAKASPILETNLSRMETFLDGLPGITKSLQSGCLVWREIGFDKVTSFLQGQEFHGRARFFSDLTPFIAWFNSNIASYDKWNVVYAGLSSEAASVKEVVKINRTRLITASDNDSLSIGTLRDPPHLVADSLKAVQLPAIAKNPEIAEVRESAGLKNTPQLLIYRINKDSPVRAVRDAGGSEKEEPDRAKLDVACDLVGVSLWLPDHFEAGKRHHYATHVTVRIPPELRAEMDDEATTTDHVE